MIHPMIHRIYGCCAGAIYSSLDVYRQEVYLKNSVDWELVRGDLKGLN